MGQLGHTDPTITLRFYAKEMDRRDGEPERLKALVEGRDWTAMDSSSIVEASAGSHAGATQPVESGIQGA